MIYWLTCFILRILVRTLLICKRHGVENIPENGSFILASNHVSHLDPVVSGAFIKRKLNYLGKKELFENRFLGWYMRKIRVIPVDKYGSPYKGLKQIIGKIREGIPIFVFPEGTRGDGTRFLGPEPGVGFLAVKFDLPVLPVYIEGTDKALPKHARRIKRVPVNVYYGRPKRYKMPAGSDKDAAYKEVSRQIMGEIGKLKERHGGKDQHFGIF